VLRSAVQTIDFLGKTGVTALTRIMGLILVCIGIQFIATGIVEFIRAQPVIKAIGEAFPA